MTKKGKKAPKEKRPGRWASEAATIAKRRTSVSAMYLQGLTQKEIGEKLGVSRSLVSKDICELHRQWRQENHDKTEAWVSRELDNIDRIETEAWAAWERSQEDAQAVTRTGSTEDSSVTTKIEGQCGDPRFLEIMRKCSEDRRRLLGLDKPVKAEIKNTNINGDRPFLTRDQMQAEINRRLSKFKELNPN